MNPAVAAIPPSLIRAIHSRKRPGDIDLGIGEPTLRPDQGPFEAAMQWVREHGCPYSPNAGFIELREAIAAYHAYPGLGAAANVVVTVGSEEALYLAIKAVVDPARDEVLIVSPCYLSYAKLCALDGIPHRLVALDPEDGFAPRAGAVLDALRPETRLVVLNSPGNPTGRVWPAEEVRALADGLATRAGPPTYVLADEVYRELYYTPDRPVSPAETHPHALVAGSLSKSNALTGMRLGWLLGPAAVIEVAIKVHQFVNTAASTFSQQLALALLREPGALGAHRPLYLRQREILMEGCARHGLPVIPPEGAFYAFVRLPGTLAADSLAAAERLLEEERVVSVPGRAFGDAGEGWLRLSWVASLAHLEEGLGRLGNFFARHSVG